MENTAVIVIVAIILVGFGLRAFTKRAKRDVNDTIPGGGGETLPPKKDK